MKTGGPSAVEIGKYNDKDFVLNETFKHLITNATKLENDGDVIEFLDKTLASENQKPFLNKHEFVNKDSSPNKEGIDLLIKNHPFLNTAIRESYKSNDVNYYLYQEDISFNRYIIPAQEAVKIAGYRIYHRKYGEDIDANDPKLAKFAVHIDVEDLEKYNPDNFNANMLEQINPKAAAAVGEPESDTTKSDQGSDTTKSNPEVTASDPINK